MKRFIVSVAFVIGLVSGQDSCTAATVPRTVTLWPSGAPDERGALPTEQDTTKPTDALIAGRRVIRLGNVSQPSLTLYPAPRRKSTGTTVLVCPGGGYYILAMDLEGTEICEWLNSIGVHAALLKYRVPRRAGSPSAPAALQDAQRAFSLLRAHSVEYGVGSGPIGVMGFSAGAHLSAALSTSERRIYPSQDAADQGSFRPDFTALIYPGGLVQKDSGDHIAPELKLSMATPPTFLAMSQDDPVRVENVIQYAAALQAAHVPLEMHVYPKGGHGYGLRRTGAAVTSWPDRMADWMRGNGWLTRAQRQ